jgi:acetyl esterase/lipase
VRRVQHRYGQLRSQVGDLWLPEWPAVDAVPVVVLIHGGWWRSPYSKGLMNRMARAVVSEGWAVWNIEYRRIGLAGGGGGWPHTFDDVGDAVDHLAALPGVDASRVVTCGPSAGGLLALWALSRCHRHQPEAGSGSIVRPVGAVSLGGVVDLEVVRSLASARSAPVRLPVPT